MRFFFVGIILLLSGVACAEPVNTPPLTGKELEAAVEAQREAHKNDPIFLYGRAIIADPAACTPGYERACYEVLHGASGLRLSNPVEK